MQIDNPDNFILNDDFVIGVGNGGGPGQLFDGIVDDIRVYNRSLTQDEINRLYYASVNIIDQIGPENFVR